MELDYEKLGFKAGLEIHAQLSTKKKLFCNCNAKLTTKKPNFFIPRALRPVLGEMGVFDRALLLEHKKKREIIYEVFDEVNCTYEIDETPPFELSKQALSYAINLSLMFSCNIVDELAIMRKNYLDGSVTSGFQRTALLAYDGKIPLDLPKNKIKNLPITYICLEEDAARKDVELSDNRTIYFKLDRLGIPLVEIVTNPALKSIEEVKIAAKTIGMVLKSSGKIRRGLGSIRQDINVSIKEGNRVELKGIAKLDMFQKAIECEINRQIKLVEIKKELKQRKIKVSDLKEDIKDVSDTFKSTKCKFVNKGLKDGLSFICLKLPKFKDLLGMEIQSNHRLGTEISERVKAFTDISGIIHTDEKLKIKYNFVDKELNELFVKMDFQENDALILILGKKEEAVYGMSFVLERAKMCIKGVPEETRRVSEITGNSSFLRELHGRSRLYPDTDTPLQIISSEVIEKEKKNLKKLPWILSKELEDKFGLNIEESSFLIYEGYVEVFLESMNIGVTKNIVLNTLIQTLPSISRKGAPIDNLEDKNFLKMFKGLKNKVFSKEVIPDILINFSRNPKLDLMQIITSLDLNAMTLGELKTIIRNITLKNEKLIIEREMQAIGPLMGIVMKEVRGKIDGKLVKEELKKEILQVIGGKE